MQYSQILHHLNQCIKSKTPSQAKAIHAHIIKTGLNQQHSPLLDNTLLAAYTKCNVHTHAFHLFDEMPQRDLFSWASTFTSYNQAGLPSCTLTLFRSAFLREDNLKPDHFIFASIVKACAALGDVNLGKQVHGQFVVSGFGVDDVVKSSLVDMYALGGLLETARVVFDSIALKTVVSWTAMISGYARMGRKSEAVELLKNFPERNLHCWTALVSGFVQSGNLVDAFWLFNEMRREGVDIVDAYILSSVIGASASLTALELGKQVHCLVFCLGFGDNLFVGNALVDMYAKCSDIVSAKRIFYGICRQDVVSWTSIIVGMAQHGRGNEALLLYDEMILAGLKPNEVTFVALLYACSHVGLVEKGRKLFKSMTENFGISPSLQHYTCLLDLYSRSGHLDKAESLLNTMPFEPDEAVWAALLSACKRHKDIDMGVRVANYLMRIGPQDPSTCILLSNVYGSAGMWDNVSKARKFMATMEVKKAPGYSCIALGKESIFFYAGESLHPMKDQIFALLKEMDREMRRRGYVPDTSEVLHDMDQQEKERQLFWHSERLAVAYGLLKSVPGTVIRIVKNLRICGDCHSVLKLMCSIAKREIVVRDANRFHHFKDGMCSCHDFW